MGLVHEASNKARGVAQAATALVFGGDQERHPGGIEQAHEELVAVALQMERDLVRLPHSMSKKLSQRSQWVL
jgi:hypothetical protein